METTTTKQDNRALYEQVAYNMSRVPGMKFLLGWNFMTADNMQSAFTRYKQAGGTNVVAILKLARFDGYCVVITRGVPDFMMLPELGIHPIRRDSANWRPRVWQADHKKESTTNEGRNYRNYEVADNFRWPTITDVIDFIRKDEEISLIYK